MFPYSRQGDVPQKRKSTWAFGMERSEESGLSLPMRNQKSETTETTNDAVLEEKTQAFEPRPGYRQWVAQSGTLVAGLLTCAGADHIITMDLHDPQYQGFFDIPVDNLISRPILKRYIQQNIPNFQHAICVSPDAGGAKRATAIADALGMPFALIHNVSRQACIRIVDDRNNGRLASQTAKKQRCCLLARSLIGLRS